MGKRLLYRREDRIILTRLLIWVGSLALLMGVLLAALRWLA